MASENKVDDLKLSEPIKAEEPKLAKKGTRDDVFHGRAMKTAGGLNKVDLMLNKRNKVVSIKRNAIGHKLHSNFVKKESSEEKK